jgi:antitoxin (DNA-binding transcriptional repressor) of toxin-antitoxin stability system
MLTHRRKPQTCLDDSKSDVATCDNVATCGYIEATKAVGLRELKNQLSAYIRRVRAGEAVMVTDRGQVVAEIRSPSQVSPGTKVDPGVARLANRGLLILGARNTVRVYPSLSRLLRSTTSSKLLEDERGSR